MNYIDLFSGIGGFALGAYWVGMRFDKHYFSEIDTYCNSIYSLRFPNAISLGDIKKIDVETLLQIDKSWIITGGFPCQDISIAGKGEGIKGERSSLWFAMFDVIRILRPKFAIIENVGAIAYRGLDIVLGCLAEIGYDAEWQDIRASDVGAPHKRERIWIVAYPGSYTEGSKDKPKQSPSNITGCSQDVAYASSNRLEGRRMAQERSKRQLEWSSKELPDTIGKHDDNSGHGAGEICRERSEETEIQRCISNPPDQRLQGEKPARGNRGEQGLFTERCGWKFEPNVGRLAHGVPHKVDRLKALGNSIVPQIAELLFRQIKAIYSKEK